MTLINRIVALVLLLAASVVPAAEDSLIRNGDFEAESGWALKDGAARVEEGGNHFLRLTATEPDKMTMVYHLVDLKPDAKALKLSFKTRYENIKPGKRLWFDGRIMMNFKDADNNTLKPGPGAPNFKGTSSEWKQRETSFIVPEGATQLEMMFTLFQVKEGQIDFDDITLVATDPQPVIEAREAAAKKKAEDVARRAAAVKPQVPVVPADKLPPMLRVEGNKIVDANGKEVWLQGVAIPSMGWGTGERVLESTEVAISDWKANVIRLGVREHFWAGKGPYQADGGAGYRQLVDDVVNLVASHGGYTVIDLHRFRAPEQKDADFWAEVAEKYKNHPAVLFELFNEPHDVSWEVWRNGGRVTTEKRKDDVAAENAEELKGFDSIGHQRLVDVVRETGAKNIVIVGGLDYAYDLSGILKGYALDDNGGNGIVYSTHIYSWKSKWQEKFLDVAAKYPLFVGECGAQMERMPFIPPAQHEDATTWVPDFLGMIQQNKLHWTGWSFHPKASPCLLSSWDNFTPTPYWGEPAKRALAGEKFEMKRMR